MSANKDETDQLLQKLELLLKKQEDFSNEINELRFEIIRLKLFHSKEEASLEKTLSDPSPIEEAPADKTILIPPIPTDYVSLQPSLAVKTRLNTEKYIGENLISKIGIIITVIGVAIGAKYSIDHELISPVTRIILGYVASIGLMGLKLKKGYPDFSAVLVSGSIAILYFITYAAYSFYELMPQLISTRLQKPLFLYPLAYCY